MITTTATDIQNNFGKYLKAVQEGNEIIILKKGKEVARLISKDTGISFLTDSLTGILKKVSIGSSGSCSNAILLLIRRFTSS